MDPSVVIFVVLVLFWLAVIFVISRAVLHAASNRRLTRRVQRH